MAIARWKQSAIYHFGVRDGEKRKKKIKLIFHFICNERNVNKTNKTIGKHFARPCKSEELTRNQRVSNDINNLAPAPRPGAATSPVIPRQN
jgi:hypothetical protein